MGFRFRRSARLGPLRFHFSKGGLSWSVEHSSDPPAAIPAGAAEGLPNSRRLLPLPRAAGGPCLAATGFGGSTDGRPPEQPSGAR
jgi:hypothetical protein